MSTPVLNVHGLHLRPQPSQLPRHQFHVNVPAGGSHVGEELGLIEDAARGVSWQCAYPAGSDAVNEIAHWLLPYFDDYRSDEQRKRILQIIAKLPKCDPDRFSALLMGDPEAETRDHMRDEFRKLVLWELDGMAASRDLPDLVIAALEDELLLTPDELQHESQFGLSHEIEPLFGLKDRSHYHGFPASALCANMSETTAS